jgi:hypothetical protein
VGVGPDVCAVRAQLVDLKWASHRTGKIEDEDENEDEDEVHGLYGLQRCKSVIR